MTRSLTALFLSVLMLAGCGSAQAQHVGDCSKQEPDGKGGWTCTELLDAWGVYLQRSSDAAAIMDDTVTAAEVGSKIFDCIARTRLSHSASGEFVVHIAHAGAAKIECAAGDIKTVIPTPNPKRK